MVEQASSLHQTGIGRPLADRVDRLELQVDHHSMLLESETGTRARAHKALHDRLDAQDTRLLRIERLLYAIGGGIAVMEWLLRK